MSDASPSPVIDLSGRVVVVTGGNSGIGLGVARGAARAGATVVIWARREDRNASAVAEMEALGAQARGIFCDVGSEDSVEQAMATTLEAFGRIDTMVANAGIGGGAPFVDMTLERWRRVHQVNSEGVFFCFRAAAREMIRQGEGGALVGTSSVSAIHGAPGSQAYASTKAGMLAMMRGLAVELARYKIRCNALVPGWIETEMTEGRKDNEKFLTNTTKRTPLRRWGTPEDFEGPGAFLCDPRMIFHTGDRLVVDGGYTKF